MKAQMHLVKKDNILIVRFKGDIDNVTTLNYRNTLIETIERYKFKKVIMNFHDVTFIDSSGIGMILGRYNQMNAYGGQLVFCELNESCYKIFEITGMFKIVENYGDEKKAIGKVGAK